MSKGNTYTADPCKNCGGRDRYVSNGNCPHCQAESNRRYKARKAASEGRSYTPRRVGRVSPLKPATGPEIEPNRHAFLSTLINFFFSPLKLFRVARKYWVASPV